MVHGRRVVDHRFPVRRCNTRGRDHATVCPHITRLSVLAVVVACDRDHARLEYIGVRSPVLTASRLIFVGMGRRVIIHHGAVGGTGLLPGIPESGRGPHGIMTETPCSQVAVEGIFHQGIEFLRFKKGRRLSD